MNQNEITRLFAKASQLSADAQADFLASLSPEIRKQLETLLAADAMASQADFLQPIAAEQAAEDPRFAATNLSATDEPAEAATTLVRQKSHDAMPRQIGRYKILQEIGEGGMGSVYMAQQTEPVKRRVALKIIKAGMDSKEVIARFEAERQALAMMDHPNIAKVLDGGMTDNQRPYFVMELVRGIPITKYCDQNRLTPNQRLEIFIKVCRAIQHAHQKGIIHRDIKPSNVLVGQSDGEPVPKVIDFGLAKALQAQDLTDKTMFTQFGQVVGTLEYMSPEQAEMDLNDVDTRTDVYSLGVLLYELLTGSTPIGRERLKTAGLHGILQIIKEEEAPRPSIRLSDSGDAIAGISEQRQTDPKRLGAILKGDLDWIAIKALDKERKRRYADARDLADEVRRYLRGDAIEARPPSLQYQLRKFVRKHRVPVLASFLVSVSIILGLCGTTIMYWKATRAEKVAIKKADELVAANNKESVARRRADTEANRAQAIAVEARKAEARAKFQLANARWDDGRVAEARRLLNEIPEAFRNFEWHFCNRHFLGSYMTLYGHQEHVTSVAFSPDGKRIASASADKNIVLRDSTSGRQLMTLTGHTADVTSLAFSPDGKQIATGSYDNSIMLWDSFTGQKLRVFKGHQDSVRCIAFNPDGKHIASGSFDGTIKLWDAVTYEQLAELKGHNDWVDSLSFSPDGKSLASGGADNSVRLWDVQGRKMSQAYKSYTSAVTSVAFSPDGSELATGTVGRKLVVWDLLQQTKRLDLDGHANAFAGVTSVKFSPDGRAIASTGSDGTIQIWTAANGRMTKSLVGHSGAVTCCDFSPDGSRLISCGDNVVKVWDVATMDNSIVERVGVVAGISEGGTSVAAIESPPSSTSRSSGRSKLNIWDTHSLQIQQSLDADSIGSQFAISPDGKFFATARGLGIRVREVSTGRIIRTVAESEGEITSLKFSSDGKMLAFGKLDGTARLWNIGPESPQKMFETISGPIYSIAFDTTGTSIALGGTKAITIWNTKTERKTASLTGANVHAISMAFSPDSTKLAAGDRSPRIKVWDVQSGDRMEFAGHNAWVTTVAYSPDGTRLASGSLDQSIKLWDTADGTEVTTLKGHDNFVLKVKFGLDGEYLFSGGQDGRLFAWNAVAHHESEVLTGTSTHVEAISFTDNGTRIYAKSGKLASVWDAATRELVEDLNPIAIDIDMSNISPDGRWLVATEYGSALLIDRHFKYTSRERAYRQRKARPKAWWHKVQLIASETANDWYAASFHAGWMLRTQPESQEAYDTLHRIVANLRPGQKKLLPDVTSSALQLPQPTVTE